MQPYLANNSNVRHVFRSFDALPMMRRILSGRSNLSRIIKSRGDGLARARSGCDTRGREFNLNTVIRILNGTHRKTQNFVHLATMLRKTREKSPRPAFHLRAYRREEKKRERRELARHDLEIKSWRREGEIEREREMKRGCAIRMISLSSIRCFYDSNNGNETQWFTAILIRKIQ